MALIDRIHALPIWQGAVDIWPLGGGITNVNFVVQDRVKKTVVRIGDDILLHHILRRAELEASRAAHLVGVSPEILYHEPGVLVIAFVEGRTLTAEDFQSPVMLEEAVDLIRRAHTEIPRCLRGPAQMFWPFHVIRNYAATLAEGPSRHHTRLPALLEQAEALQSAIGPIDLVFGHNDLLPANFLHDGTRLWLIDWDYAGFNSPLFDLGGLAANNGLTAEAEANMLTRYHASPPDDTLWRAYRAMKAAAALREALWSMVSEIHSELNFDYAAYTETNLHTYHAAYMAAFET
jgi:thiamine kinase-like enzyme